MISRKCKKIAGRPLFQATRLSLPRPVAFRPIFPGGLAFTVVMFVIERKYVQVANSQVFMFGRPGMSCNFEFYLVTKQPDD
jgi:hypothetical protein